MTMRMALVVVAAALGGCADEDASSDAGAPLVQAPIPTALYQSSAAYGTPTVAYDVVDRSQFDRASAQASTWCRANYGTAARLVDAGRADAPADAIATFECVK